MTKIVAIVAVGSEGQLGLDGSLPWPKNKKDLQHFKDTTMGHICIAGWTTAQTLPELPGRALVVDQTKYTPERMIDIAKVSNLSSASDTIFIIGGMKTYKRYASIIDCWMISTIEYYGPADTYFDWSVICK